MGARGSAQASLRCAVVGTLSTNGLNPYADFDFAHDVAKRQLFEPPLVKGPNSLLHVVDELTGGGIAGKLRPDARLSDGTPVDVGMIASALNRSPWYRPLLDVEARGDRVVFLPKGRAFDVRAFLSSDRVRFGVQKDGTWLGTGPYRLVAADSEGIRLEANPHHPRQPSISGVVLRGYDPRYACEQIRSDLSEDGIDLTAALSREELSDVRGVRKLFAAGTSTALLWLNTRAVSPAVRTAVTKGIDRYATRCWPPPTRTPWRSWPLRCCPRGRGTFACGCRSSGSMPSECCEMPTARRVRCA